MGRKAARRTRAAGPRSAGPTRTHRLPPTRGGLRKPWFALLVLVVLAGLVVLGAPLFRGRPQAVSPRHPAESMDPAEAETAGYSLVERGRYQEGLPYYRRVLDQYGTEWLPHANYSSGLHNAAQQSRQHLGRMESAIRSSFERNALMDVSLAEEDLAEFHARAAHDRALAIYYRGQTLQTWGFPLDALAEYRRALELAPGDSTMRLVARTLTGLLARGGRE